MTIVSVHDFTKCSIDTVVFLDPSWRRLRIFFVDLSNSADPVDLPMSVFMGQVFFSTSPPDHHLQSILNHFEYSTPVQRTSKCNIMTLFNIQYVFSLKSLFRNKFKNLSKSSQQTCLRRWWTKRLTKCVRNFWRNVSKSVVLERWKITWWNRRGEVGKWGWIGTQNRAMEKLLQDL